MFGGFQDRSTLPFDILGDVFLKNVYAVWSLRIWLMVDLGREEQSVWCCVSQA